MDCLTSFVSPEELSGTEPYRSVVLVSLAILLTVQLTCPRGAGHSHTRCEFCKALRDCTKTLRIQNLPEVQFSPCQPTLVDPRLIQTHANGRVPWFR